MNVKGRRGLLQNAFVVLPVALVHTGIYRLLTYRSAVPRHLLEPTQLDRAIPFLVWSVWFYLAMVGVSLIAPLTVRRPEVFRITVVAYVIAVSILLAFYVFLPTAIERPGPDIESGSITWFVYRQFVEGLGEGGCFPSGHIVFPMIGCWALYRDRRPAAILIGCLTAVSSVSILTIKEHVAWDWLGGMVVGAIAVSTAEWMTSKFERQCAGDKPECAQATKSPSPLRPEVPEDNCGGPGTRQRSEDRPRTSR